MKIILDTETTGIPPRKNGKLSPPSDFEKYDNARLIELAYILLDDDLNVIKSFSSLSKTGVKIPNSNIHGITEEMCKNGTDISSLLQTFLFDFNKCDVVIGHNIEFDVKIIQAEIFRLNSQRKGKNDLNLVEKGKTFYCTMKKSFENLKLKKWPSLKDLSLTLFPTVNFEFHRALKDAEVTLKCYKKLEDLGKKEKKTIVEEKENSENEEEENKEEDESETDDE